MNKRFSFAKIAGIAIAVLGLLVIVAMVRGGLVMPETWYGRLLGIFAGIFSAASGAAIAKYYKRGEGQYWALVAILAVASVIVGATYYAPPIPQRGLTAASIPKDISGWYGSDTEVTDSVIRILETKDIIMRKYHKGGRELAMAVVFAMSNRKVSHPPEQCYRAEGRELQSMRTDWFETREGRRVYGKSLVISSPAGYEAVFYWYKAGNMNTGNFFMQQFYVILGNLMGQRGTRVGLIRLSTPISNIGQEEAGINILKEFAADLFPELEKHLE